MEKTAACFDRACPERVEGLSMNEKPRLLSLCTPFVLSSSKGERRFFRVLLTAYFSNGKSSRLPHSAQEAS